MEAGPTAAIENSTVVDPVARWVCDADKENHTNLKDETLILNIKEYGASQRSLHNAPIFRLLLKVAVNGTHQCDFFNF